MGAAKNSLNPSMEQITSRSNPKVKLVRALRLRKNRQQDRLFVVEGIRHVAEAVEAHAAIEFILYSPDLLTSNFALNLLKEQSENGISCLPVSGDVFESLVEKENPQGMLAVIGQKETDLHQLNPGNFPWAAALIDPQDPGNVGTVLRTIDAAGASGLILLTSGQTGAGAVDPYHPTAVRASMGALFWRPLVCDTFEHFIAWAGQHQYKIYGASAKGTDDYRQIDRYELPSILLIGSERNGLSPEQCAHCDWLIRLPMHGRVTSLNLAVAAGILLYDMLEKQ